jgi:hypothetical protein
MMEQPAVIPYAEVTEALPQAACEGDSVAGIEIRRFPPSSETAADRAVAMTSEAMGIDHARTDAQIVLAYIRLKPGDRCTGPLLRESERLLRAQPFVASASVTALRVAPGRVLLRVIVVDEWPYIVGAGVSGGQLSSVKLGSQNIRGRGLTVVGSTERGGAYRTGYGIRVERYGIIGRPAFLAFDAQRRPLGGQLQVEFAEPFITDGQRFALHASLGGDTEFMTLVRDSLDDVAAETWRRSYDVSWLVRVGRPRRNGLVGLAGVTLLREAAQTRDGSVVVSDSGLVPTNDGELMGRFPDYEAGRAGAVIGVRMLRFATVSRFAALRAAQDVGRGIQASVLVAPSFSATGDRDVLYSADIYGGVGGVRSFAALRAGGEARFMREGGWRGAAASMRLDWYTLPSSSRTRTVSLTGALVANPLIATQLTFRDRDAGIAGLAGGHDAGGRRLVLRLEERVLMPWFRSRADVAVAGFADVGRLWGGDVPYGATTPIRSSVGVSLLGAPRFGKRVYRLDLAVPVNPGPGDGGLVLRLGSSDRTGTAWMQPRDVLRSRGGAVPATLTRW